MNMDQNLSYLVSFSHFLHWIIECLGHPNGYVSSSTDPIIFFGERWCNEFPSS